MSIELTQDEIEAGMTSKVVPAAAVIVEADRPVETPAETIVVETRDSAATKAAERLGGRLAVALTPEQAKAVSEAEIARATAEMKAAMADVVRVDDATELPIVLFPIKPRISNEGYTGSLAGVTFVNGKCDAWTDYRRCIQLAASGFKVFDQATEIQITTFGDGREFRAENKGWSYGQALPPHAAPKAEAPAVKPKATSVPSIDPFAVETPAVVIDKDDLVKRAIRSLRPGHKDDWTLAGLPDCNRLSDLVGDMLYSALPKGAVPPFNPKVSAAERDKAMKDMQIASLEGDVADPNDKFKLPVTDDVKMTLLQAARNKGMVFVRQKAEEWGFTDLPADPTVMIDAIVEKGATIEQARSLFRS